MKCPSCGHVSPDNQSGCNNCGKIIVHKFDFTIWIRAENPEFAETDLKSLLSRLYKKGEIHDYDGPI